jgi:3-oxoacyl-[acyl-carrier protein] reductase
MTRPPNPTRTDDAPAAGVLAGLCAVVTGGSSGIGRAIVLAFAGAGADVLLTYHRREAAAAEVAASAAALGVRASVAALDLADRAAVDRLVDAAYGRLGRVDIWVNNAGADILTGPGAELSDVEKLDRLIAVDLRGTALCSWAVAQRMQRGGGGVILNMAWDHALTGMAGRNPEMFAAVKGGVLAFSRSLARTVAPAVRVNVLAPGWIATAFAGQLDEDTRRDVAEGTPLRRWGTPEDVAHAALYLASPGASFLTGVVLPVNGGVV